MDLNEQERIYYQEKIKTYDRVKFTLPDKYKPQEIKINMFYWYLFDAFIKCEFGTEERYQLGRTIEDFRYLFDLEE